LGKIRFPCRWKRFAFCLLGRGTLEFHEIVLSNLIALFLLLSGIAIFQRVERTVIDIV